MRKVMYPALAALCATVAACGAATTLQPDHEQTWQIRLPAAVHVESRTAIVPELLLVLTPHDDGLGGTQLTAYSLTSGRPRWSFDLPPGYSATDFVLAGDGEIVAIVGPDLAIAVDARSGEQRWRTELSEAPVDTIHLARSGVWIVRRDPAELLRLRTRTGRQDVVRALPDAVDVGFAQPPQGSDALLVLLPATESSRGARNRLTRIELNRSARDSWALETTLVQLPELLRAQHLVAASRDGSRVAVDVESGDTTPLPPGATRAGLQVGTLVLLATVQQGQVLQMRQIEAWDMRSEDAEPVWIRHIASNRFQLASASIDGNTLVLDGGSAFAALDAASGEVLWVRGLPTDDGVSGCYLELLDTRYAIARCQEEEVPVLRLLPDLTR